MAKRIYWATVFKWLTDNKITVGTSSGLAMIGLFMYLSTTGMIVLHETSGNIACDGTDANPCYAYLSFTPTEDIFVYPIGHDPWGRSLPIQFDKNIADFKLQRSWGLFYRTIDLTQPWSKVVEYAVKFAKGQRYNLRIRVLKESPLQDVKWWSDAFGIEDPTFFAGKNLSIGTECLEWGEKQSNIPDKCWNVSNNYNVDCPSHNKSCLINKTGGYYSVINYSYTDCDYPMIKVCTKSKEILEYGEKNITTDSLGVGCVYDGKNICCVNPWDGDAKNPECRNGVSYAYWIPGDKVKYYGHLEKSIKDSFDKEGIKELTK